MSGASISTITAIATRTKMTDTNTATIDMATNETTVTDTSDADVHAHLIMATIAEGPNIAIMRTMTANQAAAPTRTQLQAPQSETHG